MFRLICVIAIMVACAVPASACIVSKEFKKEHFAKIDLNKDGNISFDEFFVSDQGTGSYGKTEEFQQQQKERFSKLDHDSSGLLSFEEYWSVSHYKCM